MDYWMYKLAQGCSRLLIKGTGCRLTVKGRENIPKQGGVCFISNHASIFDILLILGYVGRPVGLIAKKELAYIPFLNLWILLLGGLFIDRKSIRKAVKTINKGIKRIQAGHGMLIFPEGSRSKGQGLLPFHAGSFKLATQSLSPIVPIAISGSYDVFERQYRVNLVSVSISFGVPIPIADMPPDFKRQGLSDLVHQVIKTEIEAQGREEQGANN